jgi:competence protein ComEA
VPIGDRIAVGALAVALAAVAMGGWLAFSAVGQQPGPDETFDPFATASSSSPPLAAAVVVVDVEGAVLRPGILELPAGSRVAEAIEAAGGYSAKADLTAAAAQVNLAATLRDGQQILVPTLGMPSAGSGGGGGGGLVNLNSAGADELDALPGIGPVTVDKIIAARTEQPFGSLEELVTRKVLTKAQLDKIRDLVTLN